MANLAKKSQAVQASNGNPIADMLSKYWSRIAPVIPQHITPERMYQVAITAINKNPKLAACSQASLLSSIMKCSALGLEPSEVDGMGRAYIIPYGKTATFILGYKGMLDLARRSGEIKSISARAVYEGDEFTYNFGLEEDLRYIPRAKERTRDKLTHVYMIAHFTNSGHHMEVMSKDEIETVRARSKSPNDGPWATDYEAMAKKTVIRRAFPYLPVSVEAQSACSADETSGGFSNVFNEVPEIISAETIAEASASKESDTYTAVCTNCGNVVENVTLDVQPHELDVPCCSKPDYGFAPKADE